MAKTETPVGRAALVAAIQFCETNGPFANRSLLYSCVATQYNHAEQPRKHITPSIVLLRIRDWGLTVKTPMGKRGRAKGAILSPEHKAAMLAGRGQRTPKSERFASDPKISAALSALAQRTPERFKGLVDDIRNGSRNAAVKLHCLECSGYQTSEVADCVCVACPLWAFRPYQKGGQSPLDPLNSEMVQTAELV